jgi:HD-GYP domain-containing protein (c-di-GMP phosphodiesterase class II)
LIPTSLALDLAEGRAPGHAQRVAYIASALAEALELDAPTRLACCYAGLLHDLGVIAAGKGLGAYTRTDERLVFASLPRMSPEDAATVTDDPEIVAGRIIDHVLHGARAVKALGLPQDAIQGVATHHERWDGSGYPHGLAGERISVVGRVVGLADLIEGMIDETMPLLARRNLDHWLNRLSGAEADPKAVAQLRDLAADDSFWLGLFGADVPGSLAAVCQRLREGRTMRLEPFVENFAKLFDSRFSFLNSVSERVAGVACDIARSAGLPEPRVRKLRIAALLHDVGQLAVSERIMAKPDILTVDELETLRLHPTYSRDVVAGINGLDDEAAWVASHHERIDGRGDPDGLQGDEIPLEARILAIADAYVAITSDRPHRPRATEAEARRQLRAASGTQLDRDLVDAFLSSINIKQAV